MPLVVYLSLVSELVLLPVGPIGVLLAIWYVFSRSRAVSVAFSIAWCVVALCNLSMLAAGSWSLVMVNPYQSAETSPPDRIVFLPATLVVLLAPVVKAAIPLLKVPQPSDRSRPGGK